MSGIEFRKKVKELFVGKHSLKDRFLTALLPAFALSFLLFLFGPADLFYRAAADTDLSVSNILPACLKTWGIVFAGMFLVTWLLGGKMHAWLSSLMTGLAAAFYIQGTFLNMDLNELDNSDIWWQDYHTSGFPNLFLFLLIVMIPFVIHFFSRKVWKRFVIALMILLTAVMLIPLGKMVSEGYQNKTADQTRLIRSDSEVYSIGPEVYQKLVCSSCYRYFPIMMKAPFHINTGYLEDLTALPEEESRRVNPAVSDPRALSIHPEAPSHADSLCNNRGIVPEA